MPIPASEIQRIALAKLRDLQVHILQTTVHSASGEPEAEAYNEDYQVSAGFNSFFVLVIMEKQQFMEFRRYCNENRLWVNARFTPYGHNRKFTVFEDSQFLYEIVVVEHIPGLGR